MELRLTAPKRDAGDTAHSDFVDKVGRGEWEGLTGIDGRIAVKGAKATADLGEARAARLATEFDDADEAF